MREYSIFIAQPQDCHFDGLLLWDGQIMRSVWLEEVIGA